MFNGKSQNGSYHSNLALQDITKGGLILTESLHVQIAQKIEDIIQCLIPEDSDTGNFLGRFYPKSFRKSVGNAEWKQVIGIQISGWQKL